MLKIAIIAFYCVLLCAAASIGFVGQFVNVPAEAIQSQNEPLNKDNRVLNGLNYQSRFDISLSSLEKNYDFKVEKSVLNKQYKFKFDDLTSGEYELIVSSYDFNLAGNRYRVIVNETEQAVNVYQDDLLANTYNESLVQAVDYIHPLVIEVVDFKEYYEQQLGGVADIILNSPFGFIFKNRVYTIMFIVMGATIVAPYILQYISPDFAEEYNRIKEESGQAKTSHPDSAPIAPTQNISNKQAKASQGRVRQRK